MSPIASTVTLVGRHNCACDKVPSLNPSLFGPPANVTTLPSISNQNYYSIYSTCRNAANRMVCVFHYNQISTLCKCQVTWFIVQSSITLEYDSIILHEEFTWTITISIPI